MAARSWPPRRSPALGPYYDDPFYAATKHGSRRVRAQCRHRSSSSEACACTRSVPRRCRPASSTSSSSARLEEGGRPALDPSEVAVAVAEMLASDDTGFIRTIIHGKGVQDFEFRAGVMPPPGT